MYRVKLGKRIRDERKKLKLSQWEFANDIGISQAYMGCIERGQRSLTLNTLVKIAKRLGVTIDYLMSDVIPTNDDGVMEKFRQIVDGRSDDDKQMALSILQAVFQHMK